MRPRGMLAGIGVLTILLCSVAGVAQTQKSSASKSTQSKAKSKMSEKAATKDKQTKPAEDQTKLERATFGGGCFWCLEAVYERIPGVKSVVSGYAGGTFPKPTYELVCTGETGHAEVVQVEYDPKAVTYDRLLEVFFASHDPTTLNQQGPDFGTQYRSIILVHDATQQLAAVKLIDKLNRDRVFGAPVVTEVAPLVRFFQAEKYHQDYYRKNPNKPYCQMMIVPKLHKLGLK